MEWGAFPPYPPYGCFFGAISARGAGVRLRPRCKLVTAFKGHFKGTRQYPDPELILLSPFALHRKPPRLSNSQKDIAWNNGIIT